MYRLLVLTNIDKKNRQNNKFCFPRDPALRLIIRRAFRNAQTTPVGLNNSKLLRSFKMKKTILALAVGCVSAVMLPAYVFAQATGNQADMASVQTHIASTPATASSSNATLNGSSANTAGGGTVSLKAIRDFKDRFTNVTDEKWYPSSDGFVVYFTQDDFRNRVYYDKKGRWQYSLICGSEKKLPRDVRAMVKRNYYDFTITLVQLVEIPGHMAYLVHIEDATSIKIIRVTDEGDMDVYQEFTKA
jgi:hypothetical protein